MTNNYDATQKEVVFLDAENHRARLNVEITKRNGYPEFTMSGQFLGGYGQCIDKIKPANEAQKALIELWTKYHLQDVSKMHNFRENLEGILTRIEVAESQREDKKLVGDDAILANMEQEGIASDMLEPVRAYMEIIGDDDLSTFQDAYCGEFSSDEEFARDMAENTGATNNKDEMEWPYRCIDWEMAARELMSDYNEMNGYYFRL